MLGAPPKPWERNPTSGSSASSSTPLGPSTTGQKPWEQPVPSSITIKPETSTSNGQQTNQEAENGTRTQPGNGLVQPSTYGSPYQTGYRGIGGTYGGGYNSYGGNYRSPYNSYSSGYGINSTYGGYGGYGRGTGYGYGSPYSQQYGGYGGGYGGSYGSGFNQGPDGNMGPNGPLITGQGQLPGWQSFLNGLQRVVSCLGRMSFLVDENAQAIHFFVTALLQMLDRAGSLYGEIARLVLRFLGYKPPEKNKGSVGEANHMAGTKDMAAPNSRELQYSASFNGAWKG